MDMLDTPLPHPPWSALGKKLESTCRKALFQHRMLEEVTKVAVALSGGKDSLSLLFLLNAIKGRGFPDFELHAIHVSGPFSCGAQVTGKWLKEICGELAIPLTVMQQDEPRVPDNCYICSRKRRRLLFNAAQTLGIDTIALGHHRDDNAQTLLLNLFHKGEFAGMLPKITMVRFGITLIRPLIFLPEEKIRQFAKDEGFLRLTCHCPNSATSMRKRVDLFLSKMEEEFPHVRSNLSSASLLYGSDKAKKVEI